MTIKSEYLHVIFGQNLVRLLALIRVVRIKISMGNASFDDKLINARYN